MGGKEEEKDRLIGIRRGGMIGREEERRGDWGKRGRRDEERKERRGEEKSIV